MTRKTERFIPRHEGQVDMFTCGPSIYRPPHLGNFRTFLFEDVLQRYLQYLGYMVNRVINYTDVEDKSIGEAERQNTDIWNLTGSIAENFRRDAGILRMYLPEDIPRSSTSVDEAVEIIRRLLDNGYAYWHRGDVFFEPLKFKGFGRLFGLDLRRWPEEKKRFRRDTYPGQRWNLGDFILWHGNGPVTWDTAIGSGRPAWNVQDPAMIAKTLGYQLDISCGGVDNLYRHHDYTIAVMEAVSGRELAHYWLHAEHLLIGGEKMSKKKGNIVFLDTLLNEGYSAEEIRLFLIHGHYRSRLNLTRSRLNEQGEKLAEMRRMVNQIGAFRSGRGNRSGATANRAGTTSGNRDPKPSDELCGSAQNLLGVFEEEMNRDLSVGNAFERLHGELGNLQGSRFRLNERERTDLTDAIDRIDSVLMVLRE
jgi:cysteinyl-tRNA synthetase